MKTPITVSVVVNASIKDVWNAWVMPEQIMHWAFASEDWEVPNAENDLRIDGRFKTVMSAKDKSESFDFEGTYSNVVEDERIEYVMDDGRQVAILFETTPEGVKITETFDPEKENSEEMQKTGWQAILDNFKKYVEASVSA